MRSTGESRMARLIEILKESHIRPQSLFLFLNYLIAFHFTVSSPQLSERCHHAGFNLPQVQERDHAAVTELVAKGELIVIIQIDTEGVHSLWQAVNRCGAIQVFSFASCCLGQSLRYCSVSMWGEE